MIFASRVAAADGLNEIDRRVNNLKRQLAPYLLQFSPEEGILWQQALRYQRQRRYRAAEITLQQLQGSLFK